MNEKSTATVTTLVVMWLGHFFIDLMIGFWSVFKTIAGIDLAVAGLIAGICPFIGEGMQLLFGSIGDRGYRKLLFISGIAASCASAFFPFFHNPFYYFFLYLATCIGSGAFHPTAVAITSSLTEKKKGLFITIFASGGAVGLGLSHIIFSTWYLHLNYSTYFLAFPSVLLIIFTYFKHLPKQSTGASSNCRRYGLSALKKLFSFKDLRVLYFSQVCIQSIYWGTIFLLPDILTTKGYPSWMCFGTAHFVYTMGGAFMMIPAGYLSDRYSARNIMLLSNGLGCFVFYLFLLSPAFSNALTLFLLFIIGASLGMANPVAVALGNKILPTRPGLVSAFLMGMVWCIAEWIGPGGSGLLTKLFKDNAPSLALSSLGILFIIGTALTALLPKEVDKEFELETI